MCKVCLLLDALSTLLLLLLELNKFFSVRMYKLPSENVNLKGLFVVLPKREYIWFVVKKIAEN